MVQPTPPPMPPPTLPPTPPPTLPPTRSGGVGLCFCGQCLFDAHTAIRTSHVPMHPPCSLMFFRHDATMSWSSPKNRLLYCRQDEENLLKAAYHRRITSFSNDSSPKRSELVLITGRSGTGKSALARTLVDTVSNDGGYFCSGKFDQMQRPEPYAAFVAAFSEFVDLVVKREDDDDDKAFVETIQERIRVDTTEIDLKLLLDTVPALEQLVGSTTLSAKESNNNSVTAGVIESDARKRRFQSSFRGLVRAIASQERPLVLFLDDLQWADKGSLDLLVTLTEDCGSNEGLMLLGACRGNEVSVNDYLSSSLRALEDKGVTITDIHLSNFTRKDVDTIVKFMFPSPDDFTALVELLFDSTDGNIFFLLRFTKRLQQEGILVLDGEQSHAWHVDQDRIVEMSAAKKVRGMMELLLDPLSGDIKEVLQMASCLGATFRERHLVIVLPQIDVLAALKGAVKRDFVFLEAGGGKFTHDRVQEAAYSTIPKDSRPSVHARIGTKLLTGLSEEEIELNVFLIVNQAGAGMDCIHDTKERSRFAELCLRAGKKAVVSSAFGAASEYLGLGIRFLPPSHWRHDYTLSLALSNAAAEVEYCNGNFVKTHDLLDKVFLNARSFQDKIQSYNTHVFALGAQQRYTEAIKTGLHVLRKLGEPFPSKPTKIRIVADILKTKWMLRGKKADGICSLSNMTDPAKLAALQMMNLIYLYTYYIQQEYLPLISARIVQRTLQYGLSGIGCMGFGTYAMLLCGSSLGQVDQGYKYAQVALRTLERFDKNSRRPWLARVYVATYGMVIPWKEPIRNTLAPLKEAHRVGCETGDIEFAMMSISLYIFHSFFLGVSLPKLRDEILIVVEEMRTFKQEGVASLMIPFLQLCENWTSGVKDPLPLTGEYMNEKDYILSQEKANNKANIEQIHLAHSETYYYLGNYDLAAKSAKNCQGMSRDKVTSIGVVAQVFFDGLIAAAMGRRSRERQYIKTARRSRRKLRKWADHCPYNFLPHCHLVEAEIATLDGDIDGALIKYKSSIDLAKKEGFVNVQALSNERASDALHYFRRETDVREYMIKARDLYDTWGLRFKVDQLDERLSGSKPVLNVV